MDREIYDVSDITQDVYQKMEDTPFKIRNLRRQFGSWSRIRGVVQTEINRFVEVAPVSGKATFTPEGEVSSAEPEKTLNQEEEPQSNPEPVKDKAQALAEALAKASK